MRRHAAGTSTSCLRGRGKGGAGNEISQAGRWRPQQRYNRAAHGGMPIVAVCAPDESESDKVPATRRIRRGAKTTRMGHVVVARSPPAARTGNTVSESAAVALSACGSVDPNSNSHVTGKGARGKEGCWSGDTMFHGSRVRQATQPMGRRQHTLSAGSRARAWDLDNLVKDGAAGSLKHWKERAGRRVRECNGEVKGCVTQQGEAYRQAAVPSAYP